MRKNRAKHSSSFEEIEASNPFETAKALYNRLYWGGPLRDGGDLAGIDRDAALGDEMAEESEWHLDALA